MVKDKQNINLKIRERFANPNIFIIFVVKYDESDFFPKRRVETDRNRHIHTWRCVYSDINLFMVNLQIQ